MNKRTQGVSRRVLRGAAGMVESLEGRTFLSSVALGSPVSASGATDKIGSFHVVAAALNATPPIAPIGDFAVSPVAGRFPASAVGGSRQPGGATVTITYNGASIVKNALVTTTLYASSTQIHDNSAEQVGKAVTLRIARLRPGRTLRIHFASFLYPAMPGNDYLVSDVALNGVLDSYDGATDAPINVQAAFVDADAIAVAPLTTKLVAGRRASALFTIENIGDVTIATRATVDVGLVAAGSSAGTTPTFIVTGIPVRLHLLPGSIRNVRVTFRTPAALPTSGPYNLALRINVANDTNVNNDTAFSTALITV